MLFTSYICKFFSSWSTLHFPKIVMIYKITYLTVHAGVLQFSSSLEHIMLVFAIFLRRMLSLMFMFISKRSNELLGSFELIFGNCIYCNVLLTCYVLREITQYFRLNSANCILVYK